MCASTQCLTRRGLLLLSVILLSPQFVVSQLSTNRPLPPGKLVDVGGWRLHLNCTGSNKDGAPTVVFESGSGDFSLDWSLVQPGVARFTRACSYDRAGHAWSDPGPRPRTMKQIAHELRTALTRARVKGPYILVGQSFGGLLVRTFETEYPKEVAGIVLVDSTHEDNQLFMKGKIQRVREWSQGRTIPSIKTAIPDVDKTLSLDERKQLDDLLKQIGPPKINPPFDKLPTEVQQMRLWALSQPQHYAADNDPYWGEEFAAMYEGRKTRTNPLGDKPLIVLTRGKIEYPDSDEGRQLNEDRKRMQLDLLKLSHNSKQIIATGSGHHIQLDDPNLVIEAIRRVADAARHKTKL